MTLDDFLKRAKQLGVDGVQLEGMHLESYRREYLRSLKEKFNQLDFFIVWSGVSQGISASESVREEVKKNLQINIEAANIAGAKVCRVFGGFSRWDGVNLEEQMENTIATLKSVLPWMEKYRIKIAIENHGDFTSEELVEIVKSIGSENVGINLDTANPLAVFEDPLWAAERVAPYVFSTHIKDFKFVPVLEDNGRFPYGFKVVGAELGTGIVDLPGIIRILKNQSEEIPLCIENHTGIIDEDKSMEKCVPYLKELLENL